MNDEHIPLSEAIREGSKLRPQGFGLRSQRDENTSCALEAACEILTGSPIVGSLWQAHENVWKLLNKRCTCSVCGTTTTLEVVITHLNDKHRWTREQIADRVETIERV